MEINVLDASGFSPEDILSVRAGTIRRQVPLFYDQPLRFPDLPLDSQTLRIDILSPIGSAKVTVGPEDAVYEVTVAKGQELKLAVREAPEFCGKSGSELRFMESRSSSPAKERGPSPTKDLDSRCKSPERNRLSAAIQARTYLDEHNIFQYVQEMVKLVILEKPEDPFEFMSTYFSKMIKPKKKEKEGEAAEMPEAPVKEQKTSTTTAPESKEQTTPTKSETESKEPEAVEEPQRSVQPPKRMSTFETKEEATQRMSLYLEKIAASESKGLEGFLQTRQSIRQSINQGSHPEDRGEELAEALLKTEESKAAEGTKHEASVKTVEESKPAQPANKAAVQESVQRPKPSSLDIAIMLKSTLESALESGLLQQSLDNLSKATGKETKEELVQLHKRLADQNASIRTQNAKLRKELDEMQGKLAATGES